AARRYRHRPRPPRHAHDRRRVDPRRDRLPQDPASAGPAHAGTESGRRKAIARAAHQAAQSATRGLSRTGAASMSPKMPESVLVVIPTPALDVLLIRRADAEDFWQSVTGSRNSEDEPFALTAAREVFEETGIDCGEGSQLAARLVDWGLENIYEIYP